MKFWLHKFNFKFKWNLNWNSNFPPILCDTYAINRSLVCAFFQLWTFENYTSKFKPHLRHKFCTPYLPLPPLIFSYLQALIHDFLWWWAYSWLIFYLKWHLQSPFLLLHSVVIDLQEAKESINEEDPSHLASSLSKIVLVPLKK